MLFSELLHWILYIFFFIYRGITCIHINSVQFSSIPRARGIDYRTNRQAYWREGNNCKMEETQDDSPFLLICSSMQDLISWRIGDYEESEGSAQNCTGVVTISYTLHSHAAHTRSPCSSKHMFRPIRICQWLSKWSKGGFGEDHVVRWDQNKSFWYKFHLLCEEEG